MINWGFYSGKNLPNVRLYPTMLDRTLEAVALVLWILSCVVSVFLWMRMPAGSAKMGIITTIGIGTAVMMLMGCASYAPIRFFNFPFRVTDRTVVVQYILATRMTRVCNIPLGFILMSLLFMGRESVIAGVPAGISDFLAVISVLLFGLAFVGYYVLAYRSR